MGMQTKIRPTTVATLIFMMLFAMLITFIVWLVMVFGFGSNDYGFVSMLFAYLGSVHACLYIVFDTAWIMSTTEFDDYLICAVELYVDIIYLFLKILDLMSKK